MSNSIEAQIKVQDILNTVLAKYDHNLVQLEEKVLIQEVHG